MYVDDNYKVIIIWKCGELCNYAILNEIVRAQIKDVGANINDQINCFQFPLYPIILIEYNFYGKTFRLGKSLTVSKFYSSVDSLLKYF